MGQTRKSRRTSGAVRELPSGKWQARVRDPSTNRLVAIGTYEAKAAADRAVRRALTDQERGAWVDPRAGEKTLREWADEWMKAPPRPLRPRTKELYEGLLRLHILPTLGGHKIARLTTTHVRKWRSQLVESGLGESTTAKSYRLLRTLLATAVAEELIVKNPCTIPRAGVEQPPERSIATPEQVRSLANLIEPRFKAMVLTATYAGLRLGELRGLRRRHINPLQGTVQVAEQVQETKDGALHVGPPKTEAGHRTVAIPPSLMAELEAHMARWVSPEPDAYVFTGHKGGILRRATFYKAWSQATSAVGVPDLHFHDLRHTGNTLAAATGASTKELMSRMGHATERAALIYQHATANRDAAIAAALDAVMTAAQPENDGDVTDLESGRQS